MAQLISRHLDNGRGPQPKDVGDLQQLSFAFQALKKNKNGEVSNE